MLSERVDTILAPQYFDDGMKVSLVKAKMLVPRTAQMPILDPLQKYLPYLRSKRGGNFIIEKHFSTFAHLRNFSL